MRHEKIFSRPDGTSIIIEVEVNEKYGEIEWRSSVYNFTNGKLQYSYPDAATTSEITEAKIELWMKLKPI